MNVPQTKLREKHHGIPADDLCGRRRLGEDVQNGAGTRNGCVHRLYRSAEEGRCLEGQSPSTADRHGDHCAEWSEWQAAGSGRAVCGYEGATRRVLPHRRSGSGRSVILGVAMPGCWTRNCRGATGLEHRTQRDASLGCVTRSFLMADSENVARARSAAESAARRSYGKLVAFLAARTRDVAAAEDALSEAFASALSDWPANGCPSNPEAWLLTVARRKIIDFVRRRRSGEMASGQLQLLAEGLEAAAADAAKDVQI